MFRPSQGNARDDNSSETESDWDTTEFASPRNTGNSDTLAGVVHPEFSFHDPPTPRTRASVTANPDMTGDGTPDSARGDNSQRSSRGREAGKTTSTATGLQVPVPTGESRSRNSSPIPPYTSGFREALRSEDDISREEPPSQSRKDIRTTKYEPSPTPRRQVITTDVSRSPNWDDSDAEEQTLREVHTTFKKERSREMETETSRRHLSGEEGEEGVTTHGTSVLERWMHGKQQQKELSQSRKTGVTTPPGQWTKGKELALPPRVDAPYQPYVIKDGDGRRRLYLFNEGDMSYYEVEDDENAAIMPGIADRAESIIQRGWQEFFGVLRILASIFILLAVEAVHFATNHVARPLLLALITKGGNHLLKPVLAGLFNVVLQPVFIFLWNVVSGVRHVMQPLVDILGSVMQKLAVLLRAFRLVEVNRGGYRDDGKGLRVMGLGGGVIGDEEVV